MKKNYQKLLTSVSGLAMDPDGVTAANRAAREAKTITTGTVDGIDSADLDTLTKVFHDKHVWAKSEKGEDAKKIARAMKNGYDHLVSLGGQARMAQPSAAAQSGEQASGAST